MFYYTVRQSTAQLREINERQGTNEAIILFAAKTRPSRNLNVRSVATDLAAVDPREKTWDAIGALTSRSRVLSERRRCSGNP